MYALLLALIAGFATPDLNNVALIAASSSIHGPAKVKPIRRGAALTGAPTVALADILKNPAAYADKTITLEGNVHAVCTRKGCWMEIAAKKGEKGVRVTFKDYGFFVPTNSKGMKVRAEGTVVVNTLSREDVDHYMSEGAKIDRNADGTATEVSFVANGVELRRIQN